MIGMNAFTRKLAKQLWNSIRKECKTMTKPKPEPEDVEAWPEWVMNAITESGHTPDDLAIVMADASDVTLVYKDGTTHTVEWPK
jgi:hypothetical protein